MAQAVLSSGHAARAQDRQSGDDVPTIVPSAVSGSDIVAGEFDDDPAPTIASVAVAKPKSISFAPFLVSMMLLGFRSRCTRPLPCAFF